MLPFLKTLFNFNFAASKNPQKLFTKRQCVCVCVCYSRKGFHVFIHFTSIQISIYSLKQIFIHFNFPRFPQIFFKSFFKLLKINVTQKSNPRQNTFQKSQHIIKLSKSISSILSSHSTLILSFFTQLVNTY